MTVIGVLSILFKTVVARVNYTDVIHHFVADFAFCADASLWSVLALVAFVGVDAALVANAFIESESIKAFKADVIVLAFEASGLARLACSSLRLVIQQSTV